MAALRPGSWDPGPESLLLLRGMGALPGPSTISSCETREGGGAGGDDQQGPSHREGSALCNLVISDLRWFLSAGGPRLSKERPTGEPACLVQVREAMLGLDGLWLEGQGDQPGEDAHCSAA